VLTRVVPNGIGIDLLVAGCLCFGYDAFLSWLGLSEVLGVFAEVFLFGLLEAVLFVDADFLTDLLLWWWCRTADSLFFVDANLLFVAGVATVGRRLGGSSKGLEILFFVTFPSELLRLRR
jgi:hypothetical protein